jgi:hypothetical protein
MVLLWCSLEILPAFAGETNILRQFDPNRVQWLQSQRPPPSYAMPGMFSADVPAPRIDTNSLIQFVKGAPPAVSVNGPISMGIGPVVAEGVALTASNSVVFWQYSPNSGVRLSFDHWCAVLSSEKPLALGPEVTKSEDGSVAPPSVVDITLIKRYPRLQTAARRLGKVAGPTNDTETFERIRSILRAPHSLTQFSSYEARVKAEIELVVKERGFELDCLVDGVIVTKSREIFFWELVLGKYLFLQDARGRFCSLLPEP